MSLDIKYLVFILCSVQYKSEKDLQIIALLFYTASQQACGCSKLIYFVKHKEICELNYFKKCFK